MALSGSVSSSDYDGRHLKVSWEAKQDIATNKSTISWTLSAAGGDDSYYYDGPITVKIAGSTVYSKEGRTKRYKGTITSGTKTLTHATDGSKSFSISISAAIYTYAVNCSGSKTFTLDKIPRAATISSADNFTDEGNPVLKYSNPAGSSATTLQACIAKQDGSSAYVPYRDISKTGTSYTFNLTDAERETLRKATPNSNTLAVKFYVKTVIGGETYYKSLEKTLTIVNATPTATITAQASDSLTQTLMGTSSAVIKGVSDVAYTVSASAKKHSTISSYKIVNGSQTKTTASGTFTDATTNTITTTITDSRGNTKSYTTTLTNYVNYVPLTATLKYSNASVEGTVDLNFSGNYYNGKFNNTANTIAVKYRIKEKNGSYGNYVNVANVSLSGNTYSASLGLTGLDYHKSYVVEYMITDKIGSKTSNTITIEFLPKFDWGENDFNFNVPVIFSAGFINPAAATDVGDCSIGDYIIEEGTVDGWNYRKWNRGVMEAWYATNITTAVSTPYGNGFYNGGTPYVDIPSGMFKNKPNVFLSIEPSNAQIYNINIAALSTTRLTYYISSMMSQASSQMRLQIYAYGFTEV